jgi:hypothetical protein
VGIVSMSVLDIFGSKANGVVGTYDPPYPDYHTPSPSSLAFLPTTRTTEYKSINPIERPSE